MHVCNNRCTAVLRGAGRTSRSRFFVGLHGMHHRPDGFGTGTETNVKRSWGKATTMETHNRSRGCCSGGTHCDGTCSGCMRAAHHTRQPGMRCRCVALVPAGCAQCCTALSHCSNRSSTALDQPTAGWGLRRKTLSDVSCRVGWAWGARLRRARGAQPSAAETRRATRRLLASAPPLPAGAAGGASSLQPLPLLLLHGCCTKSVQPPPVRLGRRAAAAGPPHSTSGGPAGRQVAPANPCEAVTHRDGQGGCGGQRHPDLGLDLQLGRGGG